MNNKIIIFCIFVCILASLCYGIGERLWLRPIYPQSICGLTYNPNNDRVYYTRFYAGTISIVSSDSFCSSYGSIPTPPNGDISGCDIKYCAYDNTFWVLVYYYHSVYKITPTGTVLRQFYSPGEFPSGLAWDEQNRHIYIADSRSSQGSPKYIYCCDTMGNVIRQMQYPINDPWGYGYNGGPKGLAYVPPVGGYPACLLNVYEFYNSSGDRDSAYIFALNPQNCQVLGFFKYEHPNRDSSNIYGIEYDPRDGTYWVSLYIYGT